MELISALSTLLPVPLVLHGASGLKDEVVRECIRRGMQKVNFATELRIAFSDGAREALRADEKAFDPKKYLAAARERVEALAAEKIALCYRRG